MQKPEPGEYNPYFQNYIDLVEEGEFISTLKQNSRDCIAFFNAIPEIKHNYRYALEKWTIREILMHVIDTERSFAYRTFVCARGDHQTILYPMDDHQYMAHTNANARTIENLLEEFTAVRRNSEILFEHLTEEQSRFKGNAGEHNITARALGYIIIGHLMHHLNIIKTRYLP